MARKIPDVSNATCSNCGHERLNLGEFHSEGNSQKGDKHAELYMCENCNTKGMVEFTPPTSHFTLKGPLFGEPEDIDNLLQQARQLN